MNSFTFMVSICAAASPCWSAALYLMKILPSFFRCRLNISCTPFDLSCFRNTSTSERCA